LLCGAVVLLGPAVARADIYECRTKDGVHYTNQPNGAPRVQAHRFREEGSGDLGPLRLPALAGVVGFKGRAPSRLRVAHSRGRANLYQLPVSFIRAVMHVESGFSPEVISHAGAQGLMQLMPQTARNMGVSDPFDARQNILGGARFLRVLANQFGGDLVLTVAAYNAGAGAVMKYRGVPPYEETRRYVRRVLTHYYGYRLSEKSTATRTM
jgi:soluble lytic murein transglycosylase-like protein